MDSNIDRVTAWMESVLDAVNFDMPGPGGNSLGQDVIATIVRGIRERCDRGVTPEGVPWPDNSPEYEDEKRRYYGWSDTNRRVGQMLSEESLRGRSSATPEEVILVYGTGQPPSESRAPTGFMSNSDKRTPDTLKAALAHQHGRDFYGINEDDARNVTATCQEAVNHMIGGL